MGVAARARDHLHFYLDFASSNLLELQCLHLFLLNTTEVILRLSDGPSLSNRHTFLRQSG